MDLNGVASGTIDPVLLSNGDEQAGLIQQRRSALSAATSDYNSRASGFEGQVRALFDAQKRFFSPSNLYPDHRILTKVEGDLCSAIRLTESAARRVVDAGLPEREPTKATATGAQGDLDSDINEPDSDELFANI